MRLAANQANIRTLQLRLYADYGNPSQLPAMFHRQDGLKRLDVHIVDESLVTLLLDNIENIGRNLQSLSLYASSETGNFELSSNPIKNHAWKGQRRSLPLKELKLTNWRLKNTYTSLSKIIDFYRLLKLDLAKCMDSFEFLSAMTNAKPDTKFHLRHVGLNDDFYREDAMELPRDGRNVCLKRLFQACPDISSLHIGANHLSPLPPALKEYLVSRGQELRVLSLVSEQQVLEENDFDFVCKSCPNLEELSARVEEEYFVAGMGYGNLEEFLVSCPTATRSG